MLQNRRVGILRFFFMYAVKVQMNVIDRDVEKGSQNVKGGSKSNINNIELIFCI